MTMRGQIKSSMGPKRCKTATAMIAPLFPRIPPTNYVAYEWLEASPYTLSIKVSFLLPIRGNVTKDPFPSDAG